MAPSTESLPLRFGEVIEQCGGGDFCGGAGGEVEGLEFGGVATEFGGEVQTRLHLGLRFHFGAQVVEVERDAVVVGCGNVMDFGLEVARGEIEGDGAVVEESDAVGKLDFAGLQIEQRVCEGLVAGAGLFRDGLVGFAVLVDDEVDVRLLDPEVIEADAGCLVFSGCVAKEGVDFEAEEDFRGGKVGSFAGGFGAVDDEAIDFDGEVQQAEGDVAYLYFSAGGVFEDLDDFCRRRGAGSQPWWCSTSRRGRGRGAADERAEGPTEHTEDAAAGLVDVQFFGELVSEFGGGVVLVRRGVGCGRVWRVGELTAPPRLV